MRQDWLPKNTRSTNKIETNRDKESREAPMEFNEERFHGVLLLHLCCTIFVGILGYATFGRNDLRFGIFLEGLLCASFLVFAGLYALYLSICDTVPPINTIEGQDIAFALVPQEEPGMQY